MNFPPSLPNKLPLLRQHRFVMTILLLLSFLLGRVAIVAADQNLTVKSMQAIEGTASTDQGLAVLALKQQQGTQNTWSTYIELEAAAGGSRFITQFNFTAVSSLIVQSVRSIRILVNSMGLAWSGQRRYIQIRKGTTWTNVGNNSQATSWRWYYQTLVINGTNLTSYFDSKGVLSLRIVSNNAADAMDLDYLVVQLITSSNNTTQQNKTWWKPKASQLLSWQWQLDGTINTSIPVNVYDVDLFETPVSVIKLLQQQGKKVICYFSAGTYEGWRSDWKKFFPFITGENYTGSEPPFAGKMADWNERWLDIRNITLLQPIMTSRIQLAVNKSCDAIEPDNMDAYDNGAETGVPIGAADQLKYNRFIANQAHALGMSVGLKNDVDQLAALVDYFDFAVNEQCFQYQECDGYNSTFVAKDKAVFGVEYEGNPTVFCPQARARKLSWQKKNLELDVWRIGC